MFWWQLNATGKERFGHQENQPVAYQAGERAVRFERSNGDEEFKPNQLRHWPFASLMTEAE